MRLLNSAGTVLCVHNGIVEALDYKPGCYQHAREFSRPGSARSLGDDLDYDDKFDAYYNMSDDGSQYYSVIRVIGTDLSANVMLPTEKDLLAVATKAMPKIFAAVSSQEMHADDMTFAMNILRNISFVHHAWETHGYDLEVGVHELLKQVFGNHGYR